MSAEKYILWDWNGTLLDDTSAALATLNAMLRRRGVGEIGLEFYRDNFAFPVRPFYEAIGMVLDNEDWDELAQEYHDLYAQQPKRLNPDAVSALKAVSAAGVRQSIISALRQDLLEEAVRSYGVEGYFEHIYGVDNLDGESKLSRAEDLVKMLGDKDFVVIGDALHDKEVADRLGCGCVLCSQGSHSHSRLSACAAVGRTLLEAVAMAL
jgi:phosphoglycolate phosphatase-like HAD superfamily hydrolase